MVIIIILTFCFKVVIIDDDGYSVKGIEYYKC